MENTTKVQKRLKELGYYNGKITGKVNDETAVAIIRYKRSSGIFPNNIIIDDKLLKMLKIEGE